MPAAFPPQNFFVFRPGGANLRGSEGIPVYDDFAELWADVTASSAPTKTVVLDDSDSATVTIPIGTYNFAGVRLVGRVSLRLAQEGFVFTSLASGVVIEDCQWIEGIAIINAPVGSGYFNYDAGGDFAIHIRRSFITAAASTPLINISGGTTLKMILDEGSQIGGSDSNVIYFTATDTLVPRLRGSSNIQDDVLNAPVGATVADLSLEPGCNFNTAQPDFLGTGVLSSDTSISVRYEPTTPAHWGTPPTTVKEALDTIASKINSLHGPV